MVAQRTTGRCPNQPTQTLKGFHNSAVCRTPSAFIDNPPPNPGCAARPGALLLKSFGLIFTPQKSKTLRSKLWVKTRFPPARIHCVGNTCDRKHQQDGRWEPPKILRRKRCELGEHADKCSRPTRRIGSSRSRAASRSVGSLARNPHPPARCR